MEKLENSPEENEGILSGGTTRRGFLSQLTVAGAGITFAPLLNNANTAEHGVPIPASAEVTTIHLNINGKKYA